MTGVIRTMIDTAIPAEIADTRWYHTLELPGGVVTPGHFDNRPALRRVPFPKSLAGKRCLDIGTWDGFWAFEMERRGADEVIAIDVQDAALWDWPKTAQAHRIERLRDRKDANRGFEVARRALDSKVERVDLSIYGVSPESLGRFDFIFMGALLVHLQDPVRALSAIRSALNEDGQFLSIEAVSVLQSLLRPRTPTAELHALEEPRWWIPNLAGYKRLIQLGGFDIVDAGRPFFARFGPGYQGASMGWRRFRPADLGHRLGLGVAHAWVLGSPVS